MNEIHQETFVNDLGASNKKMNGKERGVKQKAEPKFMTTDMITPEMREAGITEETPLLSRAEMVEKYGEEKVAEIEASAAQDWSGFPVELEDEKPAKVAKTAKK